MPLRGLKAYFIIGALAALAQTAFLYAFAAPLAEQLHVKLAVEETEEEYADWAIPLVAVFYGGMLGVAYHFFSRGQEPAEAAAVMFFAMSLLPGLKWLPTPHGVSYVEPVEWREAVHGLYVAYNVLSAAAVVGLVKRPYARAALLALAWLVGFYVAPPFTLPEKYAAALPDLRALQGLSLASWGLFWLILGAGGRLLAPIRRC